MYICLKSKHVTQSSLCTARFFILFFMEYTYLLIFTVSYVCSYCIFSINRFYFCYYKYKYFFHHIFMAPGYNSPSVTCWYLVRLLSLEHCSKYCSVWKQSWLWFSFCQFTAIQKMQFWVSSVQFSGLHLYHISWYFSFSSTLFLFRHWSCKAWMAPVDSCDPLNIEHMLPGGHAVKNKN